MPIHTNEKLTRAANKSETTARAPKNPFAIRGRLLSKSGAITTSKNPKKIPSAFQEPMRLNVRASAKLHGRMSKLNTVRKMVNIATIAPVIRRKLYTRRMSRASKLTAVKNATSENTSKLKKDLAVGSHKLVPGLPEKTDARRYTPSQTNNAKSKRLRGIRIPPE